jgi:hypothetical protein
MWQHNGLVDIANERQKAAGKPKPWLTAWFFDQIPVSNEGGPKRYSGGFHPVEARFFLDY